MDERIISKLDKLDEKLDVVDKHLAVYNQQLIEHIRRTKQLEERVDPLEQFVTISKGSGILFMKALGIVATILGILKYIGKI